MRLIYKERFLTLRFEMTDYGFPIKAFGNNREDEKYTKCVLEDGLYTVCVLKSGLNTQIV